jgi:hypothetical protein
MNPELCRLAATTIFPVSSRGGTQAPAPGVAKPPPAREAPPPQNPPLR